MTHLPDSTTMAFITGGDMLHHVRFAGTEALTVDTAYGPAVLHHTDGVAIVERHGPDGAVPPHRIRHRANIDALRQVGVREVVCHCSVGSLDETIPLGRWLLPDDFINLMPILTFYDRSAHHVTPVISPTLRRRVTRALDALGEPHVDGGVYYQTTGPRLETKAEVRMIAHFADVVGMTFGHEATLCNEAGIEVAAVCSIDNMAHGLPGGENLDATAIARRRAERAVSFAEIASNLLELRND